MVDRPTVGQHLIDPRIVGVQPRQNLSQIGPGLDAVTLSPGNHREQDGGPWPRLLAPQEQPILPANRLMP